ncbi:MAG: class I SAM-dependent methyltransferase [Patescibacteria group bacterium]|jgi:SAM-dependent methyltransferase
MILPLIFTIIFIIVIGSMIRAGFLGAPWVPTFKKTTLASITLAKIKPGEIVYDLGCGDGRWLKRAASLSQARQLIGYEISILPYWLAKLNFFISSNRSRLRVLCKNYFFEDLKDADVIYCFGLPEVMNKLEPKLEKELKPGARLVSYAFKLPHKEPAQVLRLSNHSQPIYLYQY